MIKINTINAPAADEKLSNILISKFGENSKFEITYDLDDKFIEVISEDPEIMKFLNTYRD